MKFILSIGLAAIIAVAFAHHEGHDSPCLTPLYEHPKDLPSCLADIPRFYHDHSTGECKQFSYDGCNKNDNHFETKEECDKVCDEWHEAHKSHNHEEHSGHDHAHHHH